MPSRQHPPGGDSGSHAPLLAKLDAQLASTAKDRKHAMYGDRFEDYLRLTEYLNTLLDYRLLLVESS